MELVKIEIIKGSKAQTYYVNPHQVTVVWAEVIDNESPWAGLWMRVVGISDPLMIGNWTATDLEGGAQAVRARAEQELEQLRARIQSAASR